MLLVVPLPHAIGLSQEGGKPKWTAEATLSTAYVELHKAAE